MIVAGDSFGRVALEDLAAVLVVLHKNGKLAHILQLVATSLSVLNFTSYIGVAVSIENFASLFFLAEYFDICLRQGFPGYCVGHFKFTVLLENSYLQLVRVESEEFLQIS